MRRVVIVLSPLAKVAATVIVLGAAVGLYGRLAEVRWARTAGTVAVCVGGAGYFAERIRMWRRTRST